MTLYYAMGGGLGHLHRARRVLDALGINDAEILSTADVPRQFEGDRERHRRWLVDRFRGHRVIVDAFPCGIQGELSGMDDVRFDHVARLLRWSAYRETVPFGIPRFETTYVVEPLTESHAAVLKETSAAVVSLALSMPRSVHPSATFSPPFALVVHSGPAAEVEELMAYAGELGSERVLVATRCDVPLLAGCERIDTMSPADYFDAAVRIISAAGFNVMLETEPWRDKHHVVPFPRRFDDQFLRASRRKSRRAG